MVLWYVSWLITLHHMYHDWLHYITSITSYHEKPKKTLHCNMFYYISKGFTQYDKISYLITLYSTNSIWQVLSYHIPIYSSLVFDYIILHSSLCLKLQRPRSPRPRCIHQDSGSVDLVDAAGFVEVLPFQQRQHLGCANGPTRRGMAGQLGKMRTPTFLNN